MNIALAFQRRLLQSCFSLIGGLSTCTMSEMLHFCHSLYAGAEEGRKSKPSTSNQYLLVIEGLCSSSFTGNFLFVPRIETWWANIVFLKIPVSASTLCSPCLKTVARRPWSVYRAAVFISGFILLSCPLTSFLSRRATAQVAHGRERRKGL